MMAGQFEDLAAIPVAPQLSHSLIPFYDAFFDLSTTRQTGYGMGVISWLSVRQYAEYQGFDTFATYFLHKVVRVLDPVYVEHFNSELKKSQKR